MLRLFGEILSLVGTIESFTFDFQYLIKIHPFAIVVRLTDCSLYSPSVGGPGPASCCSAIRRLYFNYRTCIMLARDERSCRYTEIMTSLCNSATSRSILVSKSLW